MTSLFRNKDTEAQRGQVCVLPTVTQLTSSEVALEPRMPDSDPQFIRAPHSPTGALYMLLSPPSERRLQARVFELTFFSSRLSLRGGSNSTSLAAQAWFDKRVSLSRWRQHIVRECPSLSQSLWPGGSDWLGLHHVKWGLVFPFYR